MLNQISVKISALLLLLTVSSSYAQVTREAYQKADSVLKFNEFVYNQIFNPTWVDSTAIFWYQVKSKSGIEYKLVDAAKGTRKPLFETEKLVEKLNEISKKQITVKELQLKELKFNQEKNNIQFIYAGNYWTCTLKNYKLSKDSVVKPANPEPYWGNFFDELGNKQVASPDSQWLAFIKEYNVFIRNVKDKKEYQLSFDGSPGDYYSSYFSWSPNSRKLAVNRVREYEKRQIYFVESSPKDQLQPILHKRDYLKPGDALPIKHPALFDIESKKQISVDSKQFENQFELSNPQWRKNSSAFTFEFNQRGHQAYQVVEVNATDGLIRVIVDEQSNTFIDYSSKKYRFDLEKSNEIIWTSERDGWNHLYLIDTKTGKVKRQITKGEWVVRKVLHVDEDNRTIIFEGSGKNPGEDPYYVYCYKVDIDGGLLLEITPEKMNHQVMLSPKSDYIIDTYSTVETPPVSVLRSTKTGNIIMELEKADISELLARGWNAPEPFEAKARDGKTDIWGNIYRPTNFDSTKKYPIIEYIYAGPHSSFTQKSFQPVNYAYSGLAELGFIIVQLDGMGTSNRSKAFHDVCYRNLKDAGFPDRILWIKLAAEKYPYMDTTRVGLFGGSAGGQSTLAGLLFHPEFYKAGVSSCGCHDNRMDKIWWNEQWMGYPVGPHYAENSNVENAGKLEGKLMLIVGEMDDNVDPSSTFQVADALIKAKKDFELVVLPGSNHTLGGDYGEQKRRDFFVRNFLNEPTPDWNRVKK